MDFLAFLSCETGPDRLLFRPVFSQSIPSDYLTFRPCESGQDRLVFRGSHGADLDIPTQPLTFQPCETGPDRLYFRRDYIHDPQDALYFLPCETGPDRLLFRPAQPGEIEYQFDPTKLPGGSIRWKKKKETPYVIRYSDFDRQEAYAAALAAQSIPIDGNAEDFDDDDDILFAIMKIFN